MNDSSRARMPEFAVVAAQAKPGVQRHIAPVAACGAPTTGRSAATARPAPDRRVSSTSTIPPSAVAAASIAPARSSPAHDRGIRLVAPSRMPWVARTLRLRGIVTVQAAGGQPYAMPAVRIPVPYCRHARAVSTSTPARQPVLLGDGIAPTRTGVATTACRRYRRPAYTRSPPSAGMWRKPPRAASSTATPSLPATQTPALRRQHQRFDVAAAQPRRIGTRMSRSTRPLVGRAVAPRRRARQPQAAIGRNPQLVDLAGRRIPHIADTPFVDRAVIADPISPPRCPSQAAIAILGDGQHLDAAQALGRCLHRARRRRRPRRGAAPRRCSRPARIRHCAKARARDTSRPCKPSG